MLKIVNFLAVATIVSGYGYAPSNSPTSYSLNHISPSYVPHSYPYHYYSDYRNEKCPKLVDTCPDSEHEKNCVQFSNYRSRSSRDLMTIKCSCGHNCESLKLVDSNGNVLKIVNRHSHSRHRRQAAENEETQNMLAVEEFVETTTSTEVPTEVADDLEEGSGAEVAETFKQTGQMQTASVAAGKVTFPDTIQAASAAESDTTTVQPEVAIDNLQMIQAIDITTTTERYTSDLELTYRARCDYHSTFPEKDWQGRNHRGRYITLDSHMECIVKYN